MITDERRSRILELAEREGFVSLQKLVSRFGASESTIRRDLEVLDSQGLVQRTRGGAAFLSESSSEVLFGRSEVSDQKRRIAEFVAETIEQDQTVLLDGGTTTLEVASRLRGKSLQIVTNSLPIASTLMNEPLIELIFIGGFVYPKTGVALGDQAVRALQQIHVDRLIMGAGGVTEQGLFNGNALLVQTEQQMLESADHICVVADSTKFGHRALTHLCSLEAIDQIVTDSDLPEGWSAICHKYDIDLRQVSLDPRPVRAVR